MSEHQMMIRLPQKLHKAARVKAVTEDVSLSEVVRVFLAAWVDGSIALPQPTEQKEVQKKKT